jgi:hypothetical protein
VTAGPVSRQLSSASSTSSGGVIEEQRVQQEGRYQPRSRRDNMAVRRQCSMQERIVGREAASVERGGGEDYRGSEGCLATAGQHRRLDESDSCPFLLGREHRLNR